MIYFCNTFITETRPKIGKGYLDRGNLRKFTNFDIFKYSLASVSKIYKWSKIILKIELDECYKHRQDELNEFIKQEFKDYPIHLEWKRNVYQNDWIESFDLLDDRLIWFYCNHDHIFIDSDNSYLNYLIEQMNNDSEEYVSLGYSHWPESIRMAKLGGGSPPFNSNSYKFENDYLYIRNNCFDSIQIITKELYKNWWLTGNFNQYKLPRPDYFGIGLAEIKNVPIHKSIIPLKELCRHFDGYQHCNPPILNNKCPAIEIPQGFFDNNIKIDYGFNERNVDETVTNLNPTINSYFAENIKGTDYKWTMEDIPDFWKSRISKTNTSDNINDEIMIQHRLLSILDTIYYNGFPVDKEVENKIINLYLKKYKDYCIE
jgi:hypothetical protein